MHSPADERPGRRRWLAAVLALVVPGLGHAYARAWVRALLWFVLFFASVQFLVPGTVLEEAAAVGVFGDIYEAAPDVALFLVALSVLNVVDAYLTAARQNQAAREDEVDSCPSCGRELDGDLEFCHWCTARLDTDDA